MKFDKNNNFEKPISKKSLSPISLRNWPTTRLELTWITAMGLHIPVWNINDIHLQNLIKFVSKPRPGNPKYCGYSYKRWRQFFTKEKQYRTRNEISKNK